MKARLHKYGALLVISFRDRVSSPADVAARAVFFAAIIFIFSRLWKGISAFESYGSGVPQRGLVWYLFITEAIMLSLPTLTELVDREIQTGDIAYQLVRPLSYVAARGMSFAGDVLARFSVNASVGACAALILVGPPPAQNLGGWIVLILLAVAGAFLIHLSFSLAISMLGFWVEDTLPFFWAYSKSTFILGGLFMPIDFYPAWLQRFCHWLPFRDGMYSVARIALAPSVHIGEFASLFARQAVWIAGGLWVAATLYQGGIKKLEARGG